MKYKLCFVLSVFIIQSAVCQVTPGETTSLLKELSQSKPDSNRVHTLLKLAKLYFFRGTLSNHVDSAEFYLKEAAKMNEVFRRTDFQNSINILRAKLYCETHPGVEEAKKTFMPVIDTCKITGDIVNEEEAWTELAFNIGYDPKDAGFKITCYENAMKLAAQRHDKDKEMDILRNIADIHLLQKKFNDAESELLRILKEKKGVDPVHIMFTHDLLAALYTEKGVYDKALFHAMRTQKMMGITGDSVYAFTFHSRVAYIYRSLGKTAEAIEWQKKTITVGNWKNYPSLVCSVIRNIAGLMLNEGKEQEALKFVLEENAKWKPTRVNDKRVMQHVLGDCYNALKKYDQAEKCYLEMDRLGKEIPFETSQLEKGSDNAAIAVFYYERGNYNQARSYFEFSLKNYEEIASLKNMMNIHSWLFKTDSASDNYFSAIKHLQQTKSLGDSVFSIARNKQVEELQIVYETEKKDKNLKIVEGREKLSLLQLKQAQTSRNWMIAGASMLLIIAGLLFRQTSMRKRNNSIVKNKNEQLQHLVTEKDWLLKEIHHRVKNNLQIVMSLLNSQSAYIDNEPALTAIHDSQHRVHAMSLIHQKLYNSDNLSSIDMSRYIHELTSYLADSFNTGQRIRFEFDIEPLDMDVSHAVPLGLILNEAITNSIKYAFPADKMGVITISLRQIEGQNYLLLISDNGIGISPNVNTRNPGSLGMSLMAGLSEDLRGSFSIENNNGTVLKILFANDLSAKKMVISELF